LKKNILFYGRLNPTWGPDQENTFILQCLACELVDHDGAIFTVMDFDAITPNDPLGTVRVAAHELWNGTGELVERKITPPKGHKGKDAGYLTIRFRKAAKGDYNSLINKEKKNLFV
jgi:hypothetical protein